MTIRLFAKTNFDGRSQQIHDDAKTLVGTTVGNEPSSLKMSDDDDVILLCKLPNYNGGVHYLRGVHSIPDLGAAGGEAGFRNSVSSVRVNPFKIRLNVSVVTGANGELPGGWASRDEGEAMLNSLVRSANKFFDGQQALISLRLADITFREDEKRFKLSEEESKKNIPASWRKAGFVDLVVVDSFEGNVVGRATFPWHGNYALISATRSNTAEIQRTFVHELGHYWGLEHRNDEPSNIMAQSGPGKPLVNSRLTSAQIEHVQQVLATNLVRQGDRIE